MYLRYSSSVVAPIARSSPRASIGLSMFAASTAPSAAPAPTIVCSSSMKRMVRPSDALISASTAFSRSSNSPRYLEPARSAPTSSAHTRRPRRLSGTSPEAIRWARPSTIAVLPTPGSPISTGLFLVRRLSTWITRRDLVVAADHRVELAALGQLGQVAAELAQGLVGALGVGRGDALAAAHLDERLQDRRPVEAGGVGQREQEVLDGDVVVLERLGLAERPLERLAQRAARGGLLLGALDPGQRRQPLLGGRAHAARVRARLLEDARRDAALLVEQREQQVVGGELGVAPGDRISLGG